MSPQAIWEGFVMKRIIAAMVMGIGLISISAPTISAEPAANGPVVVELFTSQGCYSCPPAEAYLGELSKTPEIVALEYHVDYWDELVYGAAGKWKDVFSQPEFTQRQRIYAGNLPNGQVYTPQMVVGGNSYAVGSNRRNVKRLIARAKENRSRARVTVSRHPGSDQVSKFSVNISGQSDRPLSIWLVRFMKNVTTRVRSGENKGKKLISHNIVTKVERLSAWQGKTTQLKFDVKSIKPSENCAILLQEDAQGPIYGAALCPDKPVNG